MRKERERERERETVSKNRPSSSPTTINWAPVRRPTPHWPHQSLQSQHRADQAKIDSNATRSRLRLRRAISPLDRTQSPLSLPSLNLTGFDEFFFFWVLFLWGLWTEKWYYIFVWKLRKCEQQVENVFSIVFSRTQQNTRKYFPKHFLECNQTLENILHPTKCSLSGLN